MDDVTTAASPATVPPAYPERWEADVVLADGATVHVRPIRPDDGPRIVDFHGRQSPESIYFRYFSPRPRLSDADVERLTHVDYEDRMAFVALRDDQLIGVARYDRWPTRSEAEVAFFVDDHHRGRGLATLLLEYLAAAARRAGISAFTASVLPTNQRMVGVFRQAGFIAASTFEDGVIEVRLDLQPTPEAEAAIEARAQKAEAEAVRLLLAPRSVAVIGASRDRHSVGHAVLRNLLLHEFAGPVYPVNRSADHVGGVRAVPSLEAVDAPVDLAVVVVPAAEVPDAVEDCGRKGVKAVIVISAGFAESGPEGEALSAATLRAARRFGIRLLGPNCLGVINTDPVVRLHATFATPDPRPGPVALLSESGTVGGVVLDHMGDAGLGASSFAAIGNRADVSANDLLQYWAEDPRTELVLLYLESFGNARKFSRIARELTRTKPMVAVKTGGAARAYPAASADGVEAAGAEPAEVGSPGAEPAGVEPPGVEPAGVGSPGTETPGAGPAGVPPPGGEPPGGEPAGGDRRGVGPPRAAPPAAVLTGATVDALVQQTGIIRVDTLSQLLDVARVLSCQPLPSGSRVALVGNGGGSVALAADACVDAGLVLATLGPPAVEAVGGAHHLRANTIDLGFEADSDDLARALRAVLADEGVDSALVVCAPSPRQGTAELVRAVEAAASVAQGKPLLACVFGEHPVTIGAGRPVTVPVFDFPDDAAYALGRVTQYAEWRAQPEGRIVVPDGARPGEARSLVTEALAGGQGGELRTGTAIDVLVTSGIDAVRTREAGDAEGALAAAAELGYPVAAKAARRPRLAKTEAGGVAVDVHDGAELRAALDRMERALGDAAWPMIVQPMADPGVDVAVTVGDHPLVGPVLTLGPGGVATSLGGLEVQVLPLTDRDARRLVAGSALGAVLEPEAAARLEDLLLAVGALVEEAPEVVGIELNPVIVSATSATVVDCRLTVAPVERDPLPPVRRL